MTISNLFFAVLHSFSQIIFLANPWVGGIVLLVILLLSPWAAVGAFSGMLFGVFSNITNQNWLDSEWKAGLTAYNPAIVGIFWGGTLAQGGATATLFLLVLLLTILLDLPIRCWLEKQAFPPLAVTALIVGWASQWIFGAFGVQFWLFDPLLLPFGNWSVGLAIALIGAVLFFYNKLLFFNALLFVGAAFLFSILLLGQSASSLWAFTIAPAVVFPWILFPMNQRLALILASFTTLISTLIWIIWVYSGLDAIAPPLLFPMIVGIWIALWWKLGKSRFLLLHPTVRKAAKWLRESTNQSTKQEKSGAVALTGAGISTASGIPDYTSATWLDPEIPASRYNYQNFLQDPSARKLYWQACRKFRDLAWAKNIYPNVAHQDLALFEQSELLRGVVTQNVDGLHQRAGSKEVIELHGSIDKIHCLQCGKISDWDDLNNDVNFAAEQHICESCSGLLKPAVIAMGEPIPNQAWEKAKQLVEQCNVLLVIGTRLSVSSAAELLRLARENGARIILVNEGETAVPLNGKNECWVPFRAEEVLPVITQLMGIESEQKT